MLIGWRKRAGATVRWFDGSRLGLRQEHVQPPGQSDALALHPPSCAEEELHSVLSLACLQLANQPDCLCLCKQVLAEHRKPLHLEFHRPGVSDHSGEAGEEAAADAFPRHSSSFLCVFFFSVCIFRLRSTCWLLEWSSTKCTVTPPWKSRKSATMKTSGRIKERPRWEVWRKMWKGKWKNQGDYSTVTLRWTWNCGSVASMFTN